MKNQTYVFPNPVIKRLVDLFDVTDVAISMEQSPGVKKQLRGLRASVATTCINILRIQSGANNSPLKESENESD